MDTLTGRRTKWHPRRRLIAVAVVVIIAAFASAVSLVVLDWVEATDDERAQIECGLTPHPDDAEIDYRKTDDGYLCVYTDERGKTVLVTPPNPPRGEQHP